MPPPIAFLSLGQLYLLDGPEPRQVESRFAESIRARATQIENRNAWKTQGRGAQFMSGRLLWNEPPGERLPAIQLHSLSRGRTPGELLYSLDSSGVSAVLARPAAADELRLFHSNSLHLRHLAAEPGHPLIASSVRGKAGTAHLALLHCDGSELREVTEGDVHDEAPRWIPGRPTELVYQSAGVARDAAGNLAGLGAASVQRLELRTGAVETLLEEAEADFSSPQVDARGTLYAIRRPRSERRLLRPLWTLLDLLLIPVHLLRAVFHWLNFFSLRYGGKPLLSDGAARKQPLDPREAFVRSNLMAAEDAGRGVDAGDDTRALAPASFHLVRKGAGAALETLARGVVSYDLAPDGTVVYSNGNALYALSPEGKRVRLCRGERITEVVVVG